MGIGGWNLGMVGRGTGRRKTCHPGGSRNIPSRLRNKYRFVCDNFEKKQNSTPYLAEMWSSFTDHRGSRKIGSIILGKIFLSKNNLWLNNIALDFVNNQFFFCSTSVSWIYQRKPLSKLTAIKSFGLFRICLWKYYTPELAVQKVRIACYKNLTI